VTAADFYNQHLKTWVIDFFDDMTKVELSHFYQAIGFFGRQFMMMEQALLEQK
jgi:TorA maturation chaperone TorD